MSALNSALEGMRVEFYQVAGCPNGGLPSSAGDKLPQHIGAQHRLEPAPKSPGGDWIFHQDIVLRGLHMDCGGHPLCYPRAALFLN